MYFVLLGLVSASNSWRKECSSLSATSSRVGGGEDCWEVGGSCGLGCEDEVALASDEETAAVVDVDQSQPIVQMYMHMLTVVVIARLNSI